MGMTQQTIESYTVGLSDFSWLANLCISVASTNYLQF